MFPESAMVSPKFVEFDTFSECPPEAVTALRTLSRVSTQDLDRRLVELVKARASQINGCAYCLQLHLNWA
jgi:alkylhydroperoxidase family enzyme